MHHLDPAATAARNLKSSITCVLPLAQRVYTGDEDGKVVSSSLFPPCFLALFPLFSCFSPPFFFWFYMFVGDWDLVGLE